VVLYFAQFQDPCSQNSTLVTPFQSVGRRRTEPVGFEVDASKRWSNRKMIHQREQVDPHVELLSGCQKLLKDQTSNAIIALH
jgi:hypothetical protein